MPKTNRSGQAAIVPSAQLDAIMQKLSEIDPLFRCVFSVCRYTACRVSESLGLKWENIATDAVVIPKVITKKKMKTREIPLNPKLGAEMQEWWRAWAKVFEREPGGCDYVFPDRRDVTKHVLRRAADHALRKACTELGLTGVSTHSFRRSALTAASDAGVPLRVIQTISGHSSLEMLQRYLDVKDEAKRKAALTFG